MSYIWVKLDFGGPHGRQNVKMMKFWQTLAKPPNFDLFSNTAKTVDNYPFLTSIPNSWMLGENLFFLAKKLIWGFKKIFDISDWNFPKQFFSDSISSVIFWARPLIPFHIFVIKVGPLKCEWIFWFSPFSFFGGLNA